MLLCNPIFDIEGDGLVVGTSEQGLPCIYFVPYTGIFFRCGTRYGEVEVR